ncbi:MAG: adenylate/guanylate cyclase domain-containing protein [Spirochaetaceae bacterium]|jgi:class 3 adenylate cyclase|nr:adenylate/guanylate cyclase domain-containing protein [Spirochaetaceae bacterium]
MKFFFWVLLVSACIFPQSALNAESLYISLRDYPALLKKGFNPEECGVMPSGPGWQRVNWRNKTLYAGDYFKEEKKFTLEKAFGKDVDEYTIIIPFNVNSDEYKIVSSSPTFVPGIELAAIGINWQVYLNGQLIREQMDIKPDGTIGMLYGWRKAGFPVPNVNFTEGMNILCFRILGNTLNPKTGLSQKGAYYIGDYEEITKIEDETLTMIMIGIYIFMGLYHLFVYLLQNHIKYNLYYGVFSLIMGAYILSRTAFINIAIPNSAISSRIEYLCVYLGVALCAIFIEVFTLGKTFRITRCYTYLFAFFAVIQFALPGQLVEMLLAIWQISCIPVFFIFCWCDIYAPMKKTMSDSYKKTFKGFLSAIAEAPAGNLFIGIVATACTAIFDIIDSLIFHYEFFITRWGIAFLTTGIAFIMARRMNFVYSKQERIIERSNKGMNPTLVDWIVVKDRDPVDIPSKNESTAVMFTDIRNFTALSENMPSEDVTGLLRAVNEVVVRPLFELQDSGRVAYTDKFIGDAMMNIFLSGDDALNTAEQFHSQLDIFNADPKKYFQNTPDGIRINMGCGIAYGSVTLGVMGHSRRLDYTPVGDTVNLASRLESLTKMYHISILFNDSLYNSLDKPHEFIRHIDDIRVKGRHDKVALYEDFRCNNPAIRDIKTSMKDSFDELRRLYISGEDWKGAYKLAYDIAAAYSRAAENMTLADRQSVDYLPHIYTERIEMIMDDKFLRDTWDGIWTFTEK